MIGLSITKCLVSMSKIIVKEMESLRKANPLFW